MQLTAQPTFQFWIRRSNDVDAPYSLRFKVCGGRGLLRVAHPDVLLDPPAAEDGQQDELTAAVIRASRFLLVAEGGKMRKGFFLAALGDGLLERLPLGLWVELSPRVAGDMRLLVPLGRLPERSPTEPDTLDGDDDLVTNHGSGTSDFHRVREVLRGYQTPPPEPADEDAPVLMELTWGDDGSGTRMDEHTDPSIGSDPVFIGGGTEEEARALVGATLLASASMFDPPPAATFSEADVEPERSAPAQPEPTEAPLTPAEPAQAATPRIELEEIQFGPNRTALVRHLKRTSQRDHEQLEQLKARVTELERQLAEVRDSSSRSDG